MARRGSRFLSRSPRRSSFWSIGPAGETALLSATQTVVFSGGAQALVDGLTHVRLRGELLCLLNSATADNDGFECGFGVCIVSENAAVIGTTAIPQSITDLSWDGWLEHKLFALKANVAAQVDNLSTAFRYEIDSKAMRKFKESDVMVGVLEVLEFGAASMQATLRSRALDKLS